MEPGRRLTRRDALALMGAAGALESGSPAEAQTPVDPIRHAATQNDTAVEGLLASQVTDSSSPYLGGVPDATGLHHAVSAGGLIETFAAAFLHRGSRFARSGELLGRIRLAAG